MTDPTNAPTVRWATALAFLAGLAAAGIATALAVSRDRSLVADASQMTLDGIEKSIRVRFGDVPQISSSDLAAWLADESRARPQLLDVRESDEYAVSHLPGAIQIDPDAPADDVLARIDPSRPVVAYCSVGYRSSLLVERLRAVGFTQAVNLEGSIFAWANAGHPLESDGRRVTVVHPYDSRFRLLLKAEHRAW